MLYVITNFEKRVKEVELYYNFMSEVIVNRASLFYKNGSGDITEKISSDIHRILKANLFLLLYNLVESSFKEALVRLSEEINDKNLLYKDSIPEIRKLWMECEKDYFSINPNNIKKIEYFYNMIEDIREEVLSVPNTLKGIDLSGNVDARKIRECMIRYGIPMVNDEEGSNGEKLLVVKNRRNNLAHGDDSFVECGREFSPEDLDEIKNDVIVYMRGVLNTLQEKFVEEYYYDRIVYAKGMNMLKM